MKTCTKCKIKKELTEFYYKNKKTNTFRGSCKECWKIGNTPTKEQSKAYSEKYRAKNFLYLKEKRKKYYQDNKAEIDIKNKLYATTHKEDVKEYQAKYYQDNRDKVLATSKQRNISHKEDIKEYKKKWSKTPKAIILRKQSKANYRALLLSAGKITTKEARDLINQANECYWCSTKLDKNTLKEVHMDHYIPLSKGGSNTIDNIVISCSKCNINKKAIDPLVFANSIGKLL